MTQLLALPVADWVSLRRVSPWPPEWSPFGRGDLSGSDVDAGDLYQRYRADCEAADRKPLSQPQFGEAMQAVPGITRYRIATGWRYTGLTIETRAERVAATVRRPLFSDALDARAAEPWVERWEAHRLKHLGQGQHWSECEHDQPPDVVAGLAEVEAAIAPAIAAEMARYADYTGPAPDPEPTAPNPFDGMPDESVFADY